MLMRSAPRLLLVAALAALPLLGATTAVAHPTHRPALATVCTGRLASARAPASAGPAVKGRAIHSTRMSQGKADSTAVERWRSALATVGRVTSKP